MSETGVSADSDRFAIDSATAIRTRSVRGAQLLVWVMLLFVGICFVWAYFAMLDEVIRGNGRVIPSSQIQVIQNLEGGIIKQIAIAEGDLVDVGQVLLTIDDTRFDASLQESRIRLLTLQAKSARLRAEADGLSEMPALPPEITTTLPQIYAQEVRLFSERGAELRANKGILVQQLTQKRQAVAELKARRQRLAGNLRLTQKELQVTEPLREQGAVSEVEVLRLRRQVNDLRGELEETRLAIPRAEAELAEAQQRQVELEARYRKEARAELNEVAGELNALDAGNVALKDRVERTQVRSPIRGVIKSVLVRTVGGVVQPGMDLVKIVPADESLLVEAKIKPRDIAFLRPGLPATVKLTAYDFAIYGGLDAQVEHISADTFVEENGDAYYLVRVRTAEASPARGDRAMAIIPGMTAEVDILVGEKTVLTYLLKPVLRARDNALKEP